jgi:hypothetical protein
MARGGIWLVRREWRKAGQMDGRSVVGRAIRSGIGWQASTKFWPHQRPDPSFDRMPSAACADQGYDRSAVRSNWLLSTLRTTSRLIRKRG